MSFETIGNVLRRVTEYHGKASGYYDALGALVEDERSDMVLRQLALKQREQAQRLQTYLDVAPADVLSTRLQFPPGDDIWEAPCDANGAATNVESVTRQMVKIDNTVLQFYSQLAREQLPSRLEGLFLRLKEQQATIARTNSFDMLESLNL